MKFPQLRRAAPAAPPAARHEAPAGMHWHWLVTGEGDKMTGAPFPDKETAMIKWRRHVRVFGDGSRARVVTDREWRRIRRGPGYCPGISWGAADLKTEPARPAPCGWAWPHRRHPLAQQPYQPPAQVA